MDKAEVLKVARECGLPTSATSYECDDSDLIAFAARIEALALERAAKVCEAPYTGEGFGLQPDRFECAAAIRALNPKQQET